MDRNALELPSGDVLVRKVRGVNGIHPHVGAVKVGRIYTVDAALAETLTAGEEAEFECVGREASPLKNHGGNGEAAKD